MLNYTTTIEAKKTIAEIQDILVKHGASKISIDFENGLPSNLTFVCSFKGQMAFYSLPCRFDGILKRLKTHSRALKTREQAVNVGWRQLKVWIASQMELVENEMAELPEVFMQYGVTKSGERLYDYIKTLDSNESPLLLNS